MTGPVRPKALPRWARVEPQDVQALVREHTLSFLQLVALRTLAANPAGVDQPLMLSNSVARALVRRELGDIVGKEKGTAVSRSHPRALLRLTLAGQKVAAAVAPKAIIEHVSTNLIMATVPASHTLALRGIPYRD